MENYCLNGCHRYSRTIDEIFEAGNKHKEKLTALKEIAENQKEKISLLRENKFSLQYQVDQLQSDLEIEKELVYKIQIEDLKKINKLKAELDSVDERRKDMKKIEDENCLLVKEINNVKFNAIKKEDELKEKEYENDELLKNIGFLKPKLEASLKECQNQKISSKEKIDELENFKTQDLFCR